MTPPGDQPAGWEDDTLLTASEVAARLRVRVGTLRRWRRAGKGPPVFRMGSRLYCSRTELQEWEKKERAASLQEAS